MKSVIKIARIASSLWIILLVGLIIVFLSIKQHMARKAVHCSEKPTQPSVSESAEPWLQPSSSSVVAIWRSRQSCQSFVFTPLYLCLLIGLIYISALMFHAWIDVWTIIFKQYHGGPSLVQDLAQLHSIMSSLNRGLRKLKQEGCGFFVFFLLV